MENLEPHHRELLEAALSRQVPLVLKTTGFLLPTQDYLDVLVGEFLHRIGLDQLTDSLRYCLRELGANAKKANVKRVFFRRTGLDILDPADYQHGMRRFRRGALTDSRAWHQDLRELGYWIRIELWVRGQVCTLAVRNNAPILPAEMVRVQEKLAHALRFGDDTPGLETLVDETEGAGLGLLVLIQVLQRMGCHRDVFRIYTHKGATVARITFPLSLSLGQCPDSDPPSR